jgi:archaellum component FlaC
MKSSSPNYALVRYAEFQKAMQLLRMYVEGLTVKHEILESEFELSDEDIEELHDQLEAIKTIYESFKGSLEDPHSGPSSTDKLN